MTRLERKEFNVGDKIQHQSLVMRGRSKKLVNPWIELYIITEANNSVNMTIKKNKHATNIHKQDKMF